MSTRASKRQRTGTAFGAPSEADDPTAQLNIPSSAASSTRSLPIHEVPTLVNLCARVFAVNFVRLHRNEAIWKQTASRLEIIPDTLLPRIFRILSSTCPTFLSHEVIATYFVRGSSISWSRDLPGVTKHTLKAIPRLNKSLQDLQITGFDKFTDDMFAWVVSQLPQLRVLVLRQCKAVGTKTVTAAANNCPELKVANFNYTSVPPASLATLLQLCPRLEALKVAKISSWTDATFSKFLASVDDDYRHISLTTLKLRQNSLSDTSVAALIKIFPNLRRLDVSFTDIHRPSLWLTPDIGTQFEKLSLTSTLTSGSDLIDVVAALPNLKILTLGALGGTSRTMTDDVLRSLVEVLAGRECLEALNLVGNTKLGLLRNGGALRDLISQVGRRCKYLNLSGISSLRSADFAGLIPDVDNSDTSALLETLILNNTGIDDDVAPYLACCHDLATLEIGGTKLTEEGLMEIVDECSRLVNLDLTSCRGVSVGSRRRFFEVWQDSRKEN